MADALERAIPVGNPSPGTILDRDLDNPPMAAPAGLGGCSSVAEARSACPVVCSPGRGAEEQKELDFAANAGDNVGWSEGEHSQDGHLTILPACDTPVACDHAPDQSSPEEQSPAGVDGDPVPVNSNGGSCRSSGGQVGLEGLSPSSSVMKEGASGIPGPPARDCGKVLTRVDEEHETEMETDNQSIASDEDGKDDSTLGEPAGDDEGPAADGEMSEPGSAATDEEPVAMDEDGPAPAADGSQGSSGAPASPVTAGRRAYVVGKGRGRGRNRGGACDGMARRRSYVRRTAAIPRADDGDKEPILPLRPRGRPPSFSLKRKYVRKQQAGTSGAVTVAERVEGIIGRPTVRAAAAGEEKGVDRLYGCSKCRHLKGGCGNCRDKPIMERDKAVKWRPENGHPQTSVRSAPTFYPTAEEFQDPIKYIDSIRAQAEPFGIACVVPPDSWSPPFALEKGTNGQNAESFRFTIRKQTTSHLCMREPNAGKGKKAAGATSRYESRTRKAVVEPEEDSDGGDDVAADFGFINLEKPQTLRSFHAYSDWTKALHYADPAPKAQVEEGKDPAAKRRRLYKESAPSPSVEEIEADFWRIVEEPDQTVESLYGQDLDSGHHGSGFPLPPFRQKLLEQHLAEQAKTGGASDGPVAPRKYTADEREYSLHKWNINNLPRNKGSVLRYIEGDELITGVMVPWLYVGSHMSAFCWHVEDHALYSVNYMHLGAPKVWYGVPADASEALEEAMNDALPHLFETAPDLLYQLVTMVSPVELKKRGVPVSRLVHKEGTFVITFPNAYHAGFNTGFNCAEAVNFGPPDWLPWGSYIVEKYRREQRPATLSMDALLISLVRAAPQVKKALEKEESELEVRVKMELKICDDDHITVGLPCQDGTKQKSENAVPEPGPDGKYTLSQLDPVNMDDVPPVAVQKGAGELKVRIMEERRRQEVGLGDLMSTIPRKRMHGKIGETDECGVYTNTDDVDCLHCKGDLYLTAVVSHHCPGVAACPEHASKLNAPAGSKVLLYRFTFDELEGFLEEAVQCVPGTKEAIDAAVDKKLNPAPKLVINRLGPIVDVDKAEAKEVRVKRKYTRRIAPEDDLRRVKKGKRPAILKRRMMAMGRVLPAEHVEVVPAKPARAPYGSVKAAREAAAAAAAAARMAKLTLPRREGEVRKSRLKAQEIITSALALADAMEDAWEEEEPPEPKRSRKARVVKEEEPQAEPDASAPSSPVAGPAPSPPAPQAAAPASAPTPPAAAAPRRSKGVSAARAVAAPPQPRAPPVPVVPVPPNLAMYWAACLNPGMLSYLGAYGVPGVPPVPGAPVLRPQNMDDMFKMMHNNPQAIATAAAQNFAHFARMGAPGAHLLTPQVSAGIAAATQDTRTPPRSGTPSALPAGPANAGPAGPAQKPAQTAAPAAPPSTNCLASLLDPKYGKPLGSKAAAGSAAGSTTGGVAPRKPAGESGAAAPLASAGPSADAARVEPKAGDGVADEDDVTVDADPEPAAEVPAVGSGEVGSGALELQ